MNAVEHAHRMVAQVEKEVWLRLLERQYAHDVARHPELPAVALTAALDQYLAAQRAEAKVYDTVVQHLADLVTRSMAGRLDQAVTVTRCGVCLVNGSTEHTA